MDDWKLKTAPVVRLERPSRRCVQFMNLVHREIYMRVFVKVFCPVSVKLGIRADVH